MDFDCEIRNSFSEFTTILSEVTSNDYSDEQKELMMEFLNSQTKDNHLKIINQYLNSNSDNGVNITKLGDIVIDVLQNVDTTKYRTKDIFLEIFDSALNSFEGKDSFLKIQNVENAKSNDPKLVEVTRKNECLKQEIDILKQELEEKITIIDKIDVENRTKETLKAEIDSLSDKCNFLVCENNSLKAQMYKDQRNAETKLKDSKKKEEKLFNEINALKDSISVKGVLIKTFETEKEVMFTDFQLLSEEVVERDLIIQSLNEAVAVDENKENVAFLLDMTSDVNITGKALYKCAKDSNFNF